MGIANQTHLLDVELPASMMLGHVLIEGGFSSNALAASQVFNCFGTAGTAGTAGGCFGTIGTFGCASLK